MMSKSAVRAWLEGACALAVLLRVGGTAIANLGKTDSHRQHPQLARSRIRNSRWPRVRLRFLSTVLLVIFYIVEGVTSATRPIALETSGLHFVHLIILTFAWGIAACNQHQPLKALAFITAAFELPILAFFDYRKIKTWTLIVQLVCQVGREMVLLPLLLLLSRHDRRDVKSKEYNSAPSCSVGDTEPLLRSASTSSDLDYGTRPIDELPFGDHETGSRSELESDLDSDEDDEEAMLKERQDKRLREAGWWGYLKDFSIFLPYMVPRKDTQVQLCILVCFICLAGQRVLTIMVPNQLGIITDKLLDRQPPYQDMAIWLLLSLIHGSSGLYMIQEVVKVPIKQFSERQIANAAFSHVMDLSMDFHSERDSAEVMKALEQGGALMKVLDTAVNEIIPTLADLVIAFGILYWKFNIYVSLAMMIAFTAYVALEIITSKWRIQLRRQCAKAEREEARVMHQAIQGWTSVSYFNMFRFERCRFGQAVDAKLHADRKWSIRDTLLEGMVDLFQPLTFFMLACMVLYAISHGQGKTGDFIFLLQYWDYIIWPLKYLSQDYRTVLSDLIDAERLLALLQTKPSVVDRPEASDIGPVKGYVDFEDVMFAYEPRKQTIKDLSFSAQPGETIAFVGATGAGKSTVTKLLLRFYDVTGGRITIDGHDIRDVTLNSLRNIMGIVPQDPLLFNDTILENLRYAKPSATNEEIYEACRAAAIHHKILGFADGYATRVGEQGVKLSGGEIQRLAVARVILKDAPILVLDEATSAVDTQTESDMQKALDTFTRRHSTRRLRTTFVIAHRLSTVVKADRILVFEDGVAVESGTHLELVKRGGVYTKLWNRQIGGELE